MMESLAGVLAPDASKFQANAIQDFDLYLNELLGTGYKEHGPTVMGALRNIGNAILGMGGGQLPQKHMVMPGAMVDPKTGQPMNAGLPQAGALGSQGFPGQPAPTGQPTGPQATPATGPGINYSPVDQSKLDQPLPGMLGLTPRMLLQVQQAQAGQGPLPGGGGGSPASTLAPPTTTTVSPFTLAAGTPMTRADQLKPISEGGGGGSLLNPKDPNSPIVMPLPADVRRSGDVDVLAQRGAFGLTAQQTQGIINDFHLAVARGYMSKDEAIAGIKKALMAGIEPKTASEGTLQPTWYKFPEEKDETGKVIRPARVETMHRLSRSTTGEVMDQYGKVWSGSQLEQAGATETGRPAQAREYTQTLRGDSPEAAQIFAENGWPAPNPQFGYQVRYREDPENPDAQPKIIGRPNPQASAGGARDPLSRNIRMAQILYGGAGGQKASPEQVAQIGALMTQKEQAIRMALEQQRMGVQSRLYNVPPGQGLLLTPQEAQGLGVQPLPGVQIPNWVTDPSQQNLDQLDQGAPGAPGGAATVPGGGFPGGGAGTGAMLGVETPAPAAGTTTPAPTQQAPAPAPAPAQQGGGAPAQPLGAAAGTPAAAPRPAQQPQQNQQLAQQVAAQQQTAAQQRVAAQVAAQRQTQAQREQPIGQALPGGQTYNALGVPIIPREQQRNTMLQSYVASITPGATMTQADKIQASDGANLIAAENHISLGDLYIAGVKWVGNSDALKQRINQRNNMMRFVDQLHAFKDAWLEVQRKVPDAGSILGNAFDRGAIQMIMTDPRFTAAQVAGAAMMRAWNAITSNAYLSAGALPEGSRQDIAQIFAHGNMTMAQAYAAAARLDVEGDIEMWSFDKSVWNNQKEMAENPIGKSLGSKAGDEPKFPASAGPRPPDGKEVQGPDGIWRRYNERHDRYDAIPNDPRNKKK